MSVEDLKQSQMMNHILEALENGEDIGHYGRLTFAMIARHFVDNDEQEVRAMVQQVEEKGYSPPRRDKVLQ
jgi:hypothetical protein